MRNVLLPICFSLLTVPISASDAPNVKLTVKLFMESSTKPTALPAAKAKLVKDRATLKELVNALGPGWTSPDESVGIVRWFFSDGRVLSVWPQRYADTEIVLLKKTHNRGQMWWGCE